MNDLKQKIAFLCVMALAVFQFSFVIMMSIESHADFCAFDEHCIFHSLSERTEATLPLLLTALPILCIFFTRASSPYLEKTKKSKSTDVLLRRTLKSVVMRE